MITRHVNQTALTDKLTELAGESTSLMVLGHALKTEIEAALAQVARPQVSGLDTDQQAGPLAQALWQRLGRRKALILRTRLSQLAEAEDGHRQRNGNGRDYVARPSNGEAHTV
jgi:hypothetical protein